MEQQEADGVPSTLHWFVSYQVTYCNRRLVKGFIFFYGFLDCTEAHCCKPRKKNKKLSLT